MMKISEYQKTVDGWIKEYGVRYFDELTNTTILMEEVGELSRFMARVYGEQSFKNKDDEKHAPERIKEEIADIFFVLTCLANQMNIDLDGAIQENMSKKTKRDHQRHKNSEKLTK